MIKVRGQQLVEQPAPMPAPGVSSCRGCEVMGMPLEACSEASRASEKIHGRRRTCVTRGVVYVRANNPAQK